MTLYFPQLKCALLVRKQAPGNAQLVMPLGAQSVYLVPADAPPAEGQVAGGLIGGWNFANGKSITLVYGSTIRALYEYRRKCCGKWVVLPKRLAPGKCVGLILAETGIPISMGCTPVIAEQALTE